MKFFHIFTFVLALFLLAGCQQESILGIDLDNCDTATETVSHSITGNTLRIYFDVTNGHCGCHMHIDDIRVTTRNAAGEYETQVLGNLSYQGCPGEEISLELDPTTVEGTIFFERDGQFLNRNFTGPYTPGNGNPGTTSGTWTQAGEYFLTRIGGNSCAGIKMYFPVSKNSNGLLSGSFNPLVTITNCTTCAVYVNQVDVIPYSDQYGMNQVSGTHSWGDFDLGASTQCNWQGGVSYNTPQNTRSIKIRVTTGNSIYEFLIN